jgi:hypothetical protein
VLVVGEIVRPLFARRRYDMPCLAMPWWAMGLLLTTGTPCDVVRVVVAESFGWTKMEKQGNASNICPARPGRCWEPQADAIEGQK